MLAQLLNEAREGKALWLSALREAFARQSDAQPLILRLSCPDGTQRDYELLIPRWEAEEERAFLRSYLCAHAFNLLSAFSGRELRFFCDGAAAALAEEVPACFARSDGLGKALKIARRVCGGFRFGFSPLADYAPLPAPAVQPPAALGEALRRLASRAERGGLVGLDVGGSDIKLAAVLDGLLLYTEEYDWNPAASPTAEGLIAPMLGLLEEASARIEAAGGRLEGVGLSFPDVVIRDCIVGGETPKTRGMRENRALDYETEFAKLRELKQAILARCAPGGRCRICNDGSMAAFTAAMELAAAGEDELIGAGVIAHSLGTDLGTGWLLPDGSIPQIPLELYDLLLDLGSLPAASLPPEDLRSSRNENSGLPGLRRYLGQAAAYRLAYARDPALLDGYVRRDGDCLTIPTAPEDLRKPALSRLMRAAEEGNADAQEVFRQIGRHLAVVTGEMAWLFGAQPPVRFLFGRFVKSRRCFTLLCEGFSESGLGVELVCADEELANSPLMRALAARPDATVAQFGQAVGAAYFALCGGV